MSLADTYPFYLANEAHCPNTDLEVTDKYTGEVATRVALASPDDIDRAIAATVEATEPMSGGVETTSYTMARTSSGLLHTRITSAVSTAKSEPAPMAMPTSA